MTLRLIDGSEFLHIPKTGGSWVKEVMYKNNLVSYRRSHEHADYDFNLLVPISGRRSGRRIREAARFAQNKVSKLLKPSNSEADSTFRFCFVRHPLSWYESYWKYMNGRDKGWTDWGVQNSRRCWHPNSTLNGLGSSDFNQFVRNVVHARPGYVSEMLFSYTKPGISFIGKTENLRDDLAYVIDLLGLEYDRSTFEKSPRKNVSKTNPSKVEWDPKLRATVMRLELPALVHFDYLTEEEKAELGIDIPVSANPALKRQKQLVAV